MWFIFISEKTDLIQVKSMFRAVDLLQQIVYLWFKSNRQDEERRESYAVYVEMCYIAYKSLRIQILAGLTINFKTVSSWRAKWHGLKWNNETSLITWVFTRSKRVLCYSFISQINKILTITRLELRWILM